MSAHVFCRDLSIARGEPIEGMGYAAEKVLMLAWPRGKWRPYPWESVDLEPVLAAAMEAASDSGIHMALVDRVGASDSLPTLMAQPESIAADFETQGEIAAAIRAYMDGEVFAGRVEPRVTVMICTDSRQDACCARYGFATYKAMMAEADPSRFNIVQANHIGGCRFAASLMVLPSRQRYGRMSADQVPGFLEALLRNDVYLPAYKGHADWPEPLQVAEIAAMRWAEENGYAPRRVRLSEAALADQSTEPVAQGQSFRVAAEVDGVRLDICLEVRSFFMQGNCEIVASHGGEQSMRWCLDRLTASLRSPNTKAIASC